MKYYNLSASIGYGKTELTSFDDALLNSKIANYNLVKVSSILPAFTVYSSIITIPEGDLLYTAYATQTTNKNGVKISAAIAAGIPSDPHNIGVIMEFSGNCSLEVAKKNVSQMVVEAMGKRRYDLKEILCEATEAIGDGNQFITALATLDMF